MSLDFGGIQYSKYFWNHFKNKKTKKIYTIKIMRNQFTDYKTLLQIFSLQEQIDEINAMIKTLVNKKHIANINDRRYDRIKELKYKRDNILNKIYT